MRLRSRHVAAVVAISLACVFETSHAAGPAEPLGYRLDEYRSAVPETVDGRPALTTADARTLWESGAAVFIDTLPQVPRPEGLPAGTIWNPKPRLDIPGSIWLPDTGYGALPPAMEAWFAASLEHATAGNHQRRLVFYCLAECWMSWNATRRARLLGFVNAEWYASGTDGWSAQNLPLENRESALGRP